MKIRLAALLLIAWIASSIATVQAYQIRANRGLNLRADSSLQSRVVDTVRSGDILQVVGSANNWLEIDRNGRIVWLASWTDYSRVGETTQPVQQSSAPIDNCCFVDRQCSSEGEWTGGFYSFQRECPVPQADTTQPPAADYAQPIGAIRPAPYLPVSQLDWSRVNEPGIDNCCQIGWDCINDEEWQQGYRVYQASRCHHSHILVDGNANFKSIMETAFEQLRIKQPHWYSFAVSGLNRVHMRPDGQVSSVNTAARDYGESFNPDLVWGRWDVYDRAGGLVHEACHVHMYNRGEARSSWQNEEPCLEVQILAGEGIAHEGFQNTYLRELLANIQNPTYWWWD